MHTAIRSKFSNKECGTRKKSSFRRPELVQMMRNLGIKRSYANSSQTVLGKDGKTRAKRVVKKVKQMCDNISKAIDRKPANTSVNGYKPLYKIFKTPRAAPARNVRVARASTKLDLTKPLYQMFATEKRKNNTPPRNYRVAPRRSSRLAARR